MRAIDMPGRTGGRARPVVGVALALALATGWTQDGASTALAPSPDGQEVINIQAGIAWARCVEGMRWTGKTCTGTPRLLDHAQAQAAAAARRQADGKAWRLPRVPELKRLASQSAQPPAFPATPLDWHWTSTTTVDISRVNPYDYNNIRKGVTNENVSRISFLHGWAVHMGSADADGTMAKRTPLPVRLVRSLDR